MRVEQRLSELGLDLPEARQPAAATYVNAVRVGNLVFLWGTGPVAADGHIPSGKVRGEVE